MPEAAAVGSGAAKQLCYGDNHRHHQAAALPHIVPTQRANVKLMKMKTSAEAASNLDGDSVYHPTRSTRFISTPRRHTSKFYFTNSLYVLTSPCTERFFIHSLKYLHYVFNSTHILCNFISSFIFRNCFDSKML